jgi:NitT/TauT family transport system permease protein
MTAVHQTSDAAADAAAPEPARGSRARSGTGLRSIVLSILSLVILVLIVIAWQVTADHWIRPIWISSPRLVYHDFISMAKDGSLARNTWTTAQEALLGLVIGTGGGIVGGIALAKAKSVATVLNPYVLGAYSLPRVALAPFFVLWFGIGLTSKVALVVSIVFFMVVFNVKQGMESIDRDLVDAMRSMHAGPIAMLRYVTVPSLLPWLFASVKICIGMALIGAVVGELVGASKGLGWSMTNALNNFDTTTAFTSLLVMLVLAMVLYYVMAFAEARMFRWRSNGTDGGIPT